MATTAETLAIVRRQLAPSGVLRAAINTANFLLVTSYDDAGLPQGVSPDMAMALAEKISVQCRLIPYKTPSDVADAMATESWDIANIGAEPERAKVCAVPVRVSPRSCEQERPSLRPVAASHCPLRENPLRTVTDHSMIYGRSSNFRRRTAKSKRLTYCHPARPSRRWRMWTKKGIGS